MRTTAAGEDQPAIGVAAWVSQLQSPAPEPARSRRMAPPGSTFTTAAAMGAGYSPKKALRESSDYEVASLQAVPGDWAAIETMSLWMFHTPDGAVRTLPPGVPAIAARPVR
jgi:hypothetical protein